VKNIKFLILFFSILVFNTLESYSQENGIVKFFVEVDNGYFEIEINDTMLLKRYKDTLPAGDYTAKVWSPGYVVNRIDFTVVAGATTEKHVEMAKNNNYLKYEQDYRTYRLQFHKQFTIPLSVSLASAITSVAFGIRAFDTRRQLVTDVDLYNKTPITSAVLELKTRIDEGNRRFNRQRTAFYINTGFTVAFIGTTIFSYINFNKNYTEPVFDKESPFKDKFSFNFTPYGGALTFDL